MVAWAKCEDCENGKHCHGTNDVHVPPELLEQGFCGGFICSCDCRDEEESDAVEGHR